MKAISWRAPYFDLRSGLFIPCVVTWDADADRRAKLSRRMSTWMAYFGPPGKTRPTSSSWTNSDLTGTQYRVAFKVQKGTH